MGCMAQNKMEDVSLELPHLWGLGGDPKPALHHQGIKLEQQSSPFEPHFKCSRKECFLQETYTNVRGLIFAH